MENPAVIWASVGLMLVIVELLSGTFYLLVLGGAAFGAAGAALLGQNFPMQVLVFAIVSAIGMYFVHSWRVRNLAAPMTPIDAGQPAIFEEWIDRGTAIARVRYRGASWEAKIEDSAGTLEPGARVYVRSTEGNRLNVSVSAPA